MSALAVVSFPIERESILDRNKRQVFVSVAMLAMLGVFGDLHPACALDLGLLPRERRHKIVRIIRGESRPEGYVTVELPARWPSTDYLAELVHEWGYCPSAAWSVPYHPMPTSIDRRKARRTPTIDEADSFSDKRHAELGNFSKFQNTPDPMHPYVPASPMRRTTTSIAKRRSEKFLEEHDILGSMRDVHMAFAVAKCITRGKSARVVANEEGLSFVALHRALARANERIRDLENGEASQV
jgi:hypothetical protein